MSDINVDDFFKDAARVLLVLYAAFPRRHSVFVEDICGNEEPDEFGLPSDRHLACFGAMLWMGEENLLRFEDTIRSEAIDQAVLTGSCFTLLSVPIGNRLSPVVPSGSDVEVSSSTTDLPESILIEQSTHIYRIRQALEAKSSKLIRAAMLDLLTRIPPQR